MSKIDKQMRERIEFEIRDVVDNLSGILGLTLGEAVRRKNKVIRQGADKIYKLIK